MCSTGKLGMVRKILLKYSLSLRDRIVSLNFFKNYIYSTIILNNYKKNKAKRKQITQIEKKTTF